MHEELKRKNQVQQCKICQKSFFDKQVLDRHRRSVHEGLKDSTCDVCGNSFSRIDVLKKHVKKFHDKIQTSKDHKCGSVNHSLETIS